MNYLIKLLLLVVMGFSIVHEVVVKPHDENACSITEYVAEFSTPLPHDANSEHKYDLCESHFMFHLSFLLPSHFSLVEITQEQFLTSYILPFPLYSYSHNSFRPPIA